MKKKMKNRLFAIMMSFAMLFTMMPMTATTAYADDPAPPPPAIALGADILAVGVNTSGAATVHMADTTWRVIGYKGDGVAGTAKNPEVPGSADTMTLIAAGILKTNVPFNPESNVTNVYKDSNLYNEILKLTDGDEAIFSESEMEGIAARDLEQGAYTNEVPYTDGIAGEKVEGALLWPLSTQEAYYMDGELRETNNFWWLRSPGYAGNLAAYGHYNGLVYGGGGSVDYESGAVRPAFRYDLDSVLFTSAAVGGKSGEAHLLNEVGTNTDNAWKLTIKDDAHKGFEVTDVMKDYRDNIFYISYKGAAKENNEYVSAIIKSIDGKIKRYGRFGGVPGGGTGQITCRVSDGMLEAGDTLCIFNEQCNGDNKTDFASELAEVYTEPVPPTITQQPKDLKLTYGDTTGTNTLEVAAEAEEGCTLSYQWYRKDSENAEPVLLENETNTSYTVPTGQNVGTMKYYYCKVTATRTGDGETASADSKTANVTIRRRDVTVKAEDQEYIYTGEFRGPGGAVYDDPDELAEVIEVSGLLPGHKVANITIDGQGKDVGKYDDVLEPHNVRIVDDKGNTVSSNYAPDYKKATLWIKRELNITVNGSSSNTVYNGREQTYTGQAIAECDDEGFNRANFSYDSTTAVKGTDAGQYTTKINEADCKYADDLSVVTWTVGEPVRLNIDKAAITITADDKSSKAGEALKDLTYTVNGGFVRGDDLGVTLGTDANKNKAGTYDIKVSWNENPNYDARLVNGQYTVKRKAVPQPVLYRISVSVQKEMEEWGTVEGGGTYTLGRKTTVKAVPNEGYHFKEWMEKDESVSTDAEYTFTVTKTRSLEAVFEPDELLSIKLGSDGAKKVYTQGDELDVTGLFMELLKAGGETGTIPVTPDMVSGFDSSIVGTQTLTVSYEDFTDSYEIEILKKEPLPLEGVSAKGYTGTYDGKGHSIEVSAPDGAVVTYSRTKDGAYGKKRPSCKNAGTYTVFYRVKKAGYKTVTGSAKVKIKKASITIRAVNKSSRRGEKLKKLTSKVTGAYVKGDKLGIKLSTKAKKNKAGKYGITVSWNKNKNYKAKLVKGTYTVK